MPTTAPSVWARSGSALSPPSYLCFRASRAANTACHAPQTAISGDEWSSCLLDTWHATRIVSRNPASDLLDTSRHDGVTRVCAKSALPNLTGHNQERLQGTDGEDDHTSTASKQHSQLSCLRSPASAAVAASAWLDAAQQIENMIHSCRLRTVQLEGGFALAPSALVGFRPLEQYHRLRSGQLMCRHHVHRPLRPVGNRQLHTLRYDRHGEDRVVCTGRPGLHAVSRTSLQASVNSYPLAEHVCRNSCLGCATR